MIRTSCIIAAYNEQPRIGKVLDVISSHPLIDEVIVVDDGSSDGTVDVVSSYSNVKLIRHQKNRGKSAAVYSGIKESHGEYLILIDADLIGLCAHNLTDLITPVINKSADVSMSLRRNTPWLWRAIGIDYITGERMLPKKMFEGQLERLLSLPGFGLEAFFNTLIIKNHYRITIVPWNNVDSPYPSQKRGGFWKGIKGMARMMTETLRTSSLTGAVGQILRLRQLRVNGIIHKYKISFVIPAHNEEEYIKECLASVIRAIHDNALDAEIIVVNNASTDRTKAIALGLPGIRVVDEPEKGISRARQSGFLASTGDLIANIDADTILPDAWVPFVLNEFMSNPKLLALSGPHIYHDVPVRTGRMVRLFYRLAYMSYLINRFVLRSSSLLQGGNFIIRRQALEKIGGFDPRFTFWGEDTDIARRLHMIGKVKFTLQLPIYASGRRLLVEGPFRAGWRYALNHYWTIFSHKPYSHTNQDIRSTQVSQVRDTIKKHD